MKKTLIIAWVILAAALFVMPYAYWKIDSEKESVVVTEETIWGSPAEGAGIRLRIASCFGEEMRQANGGQLTDKHLMWDTVYAVGGESGAESVSAFSSHETVGGRNREEESIVMELENNFGMSSVNIDLNTLAMSKIFQAVSERTAAGEERTELIRVGDYYEYYPIAQFWPYSGGNPAFRNTSTAYYDTYYQHLTDFFHIPTGEDMVEVEMKKNSTGTITYVGIRDKSGIEIYGTAAFGEEGCWYTYNCESREEIVDRGQNRGIFYLPLQEEEGRRFMDLDQIRKVCSLPAGTIPVKLLLDEPQKRLFLLVRGEREFSLAVYTIEDEIPILSQQISVLECQEGEDGEIRFPYWRKMTMEDGGILILWEDSLFSFAAEEEGQFELWYGGSFPVDGREEDVLSQENAGSRGLWKFLTPAGDNSDQEFDDSWQNPRLENPCFLDGNACFFDGERLVLASQTRWRDTDVLLSVYRKEGLVYCGLYQYGGVNDAYTWLAEDAVRLQGSGDRACSIRLEEGTK